MAEDVRIWDGLVRGLPFPGGQLRVVSARPAGTARGSFIVLPGRGEFLEKYAPTAAWLRVEGFALLGVDWRGQGGSSRLMDDGRGHIDDFDHYLDDLDRLMAFAGSIDLPRPWAFLAHSMGGHLALRWLGERRHTIDRCILVAPMLGLELARLPRPVARALTWSIARMGQGRRYAPGQSGPGHRTCRFEGNKLTSCPESFAAWRELVDRHPDAQIGGVTWGWLESALRSIAVTRRPGFVERITTPTLVLLAEAEAVVSNSANLELASRMPHAEVHQLPEARHDLLWERAETVAAIRRAILRHLEPPTA